MSSVILKDGIKIKGFLGGDRNVPLFIQFVEGQLTNLQQQGT